MGLPPETMNVIALCGAVLHLCLISVIAYRMGYLWRSISIPWVVTFALSAVHQVSTYHEADKVGVSLDGAQFLMSSLARSAAAGLFVTLVVLAVRGPRKTTMQSTEVSHA